EDVELAIPLADVDRAAQLLEERRDVRRQLAVLLDQTHVQHVEAHRLLAEEVAEARDEEAALVLRGKGPLAVERHPRRRAVRVERVLLARDRLRRGTQVRD